jgi:hypothetical protein
VPADLERLARDFATTVQGLLNQTICKDIRIAAVVSPDPNVVLVGYGLGRASLLTERFPVGIKGRKPLCWLDVQYRLCLDDKSQYLTVVASFFGIYAADSDQSCLCHFDYEREKTGGYAVSHLQVEGTSEALAAWGDPKRTLGRLHFPAGGRRYRLTLEDVIQFMITEELADARPGWLDFLEAEREKYRRIQLRAAIRRDTGTAADVLREHGYTVMEPHADR